VASREVREEMNNITDWRQFGEKKRRMLVRDPGIVLRADHEKRRMVVLLRSIPNGLPSD